jgi:hypothetical protein
MVESETALRTAVDEGKSDPKSFPWYMEDLSSLSEPARRLLEEYSHIPPEEVEGHVKSMVCRGPRP